MPNAMNKINTIDVFCDDRMVGQVQSFSITETKYDGIFGELVRLRLIKDAKFLMFSNCHYCPIHQIKPFIIRITEITRFKSNCIERYLLNIKNKSRVTSIEYVMLVGPFTFYDVGDYMIFDHVNFNARKITQSKSK